MLVSASDGRSGGLVMFWNNDISVTSKEVTPNYIDIRINEHSEAGCRLTGLYGEPSGERKHLTWQYIRELHAAVDLPWLLAGDFNEILYSHEKEGGAPRSQRCMQVFRDTLSECDLEDQGYIGDVFTWRRGQLRERLDRSVCDPRWAAMFPLAAVINDDFGKSDHRPIVINTEYNTGLTAVRQKAPLKFEARWLCESSVEHIIQMGLGEGQTFA